jgi:hypothetical protein
MMSPTCQDFASAKLKKEGDASQEKLKLKNKNYVTCPPPTYTEIPVLKA